MDEEAEFEVIRTEKRVTHTIIVTGEALNDLMHMLSEWERAYTNHPNGIVDAPTSERYIYEELKSLWEANR